MDPILEKVKAQYKDISDKVIYCTSKYFLIYELQRFPKVKDNFVKVLSLVVLLGPEPYGL